MSIPVNENHTDIDQPPARLSPLHRTHRALGARFGERAGWQVPEAYTSPEDEAAAVRERVGVMDVSAAGKLLVKGDVETLLAGVFDTVPESPGEVSPATVQNKPPQPASQIRIARLTADEYLLLTPPGTEQELLRTTHYALRNTQYAITLLNQTSGLAGLLIAGPHSRPLLSKLCALPFGPAAFLNHHVAQSSLARVHAVILRNDFGAMPAFELYFDRAYAEYIWASVMDAGYEFGMIPFGWQCESILRTWAAN